MRGRRGLGRRSWPWWARFSCPAFVLCDEARIFIDCGGMKIMGLVILVMCFCAGAQTNSFQTATNKFKSNVAPVAAVAASQPKQITIISVGKPIPPNYPCETSIGSVYLVGLPPALKTELENIAQLEAFSTRETTAIEEAWRTLRSEKAAAPSSASSGSPAGQYIRQLNIRQNNLEERERALDKTTRALEAARGRLEKLSAVHAVNTGRKYGAREIWQVVASPTKPPTTK